MPDKAMATFLIIEDCITLLTLSYIMITIQN